MLNCNGTIFYYLHFVFGMYPVQISADLPVLMDFHGFPPLSL